MGVGSKIKSVVEVRYPLILRIRYRRKEVPYHEKRINSKLTKSQ